MFCRKCGSQNDDNAIQCSQCGEALQEASQYQQPVQDMQNMPDVSSHLVLAILTTLFCCLPFGIVSIVYAAQVGSKKSSGDYQGALECSKKAATWGWVAFGIGLVMSIIWMAITMLGVFAQQRSMQGF